MRRNRRVNRNNRDYWQRALYIWHSNHCQYNQTKNYIISNLAHYYVEEIISTISSQTYLMAGNCIGSFLVSEIALILHEKGYKIGFIGVVERDVTEKSIALTAARLTFYSSDLVGYFVNDMRLSFRTKNLNRVLKSSQHLSIHSFSTIKAMLGLLGGRQLLNIFMKFNDNEKSGQQPQILYQLKPYPYKLNLIFIRWGVFGMYQFKYFQNFWRKLAQNGMEVDLVPGHSHYHPKWHHIIDKLNIRIKETETLN